jgi:hypothetical protein
MMMGKLTKPICALTSLIILLASCSQPRSIVAAPTYKLEFTETIQVTATKEYTPIAVATVTPYTQESANISTLTSEAHDISMFYGHWVITRWEHYRASADLTDEYANSQVGNGVSFTNTQITFDDDFLWLSKKHNCSNAFYRWSAPEDFMNGVWQLLLPDESPSKRQNELLAVFIDCQGKNFLEFEVAKSGEIVIYYDCYWFFLEKKS